MEAQFPALRHALGAELFRDFAAEYVRALPPESYTLYDLGRRFADHLEASRPDKDSSDHEREGWIDFMVDLARFERQLFLMFDAPGHEGQPFADEDVPDDRLMLQPCVALGDYRFPVSQYYHEIKEDRDPTYPPRMRSTVALVRKDYLTHTFPITSAQHTFLSALEEGSTVDSALAKVADETGLPLNEVRASWSEEDGVRTRWFKAGFFVERH